MKNKIVEAWQGMNGKQRKLVTWVGGGSIVLIIGILGATAMRSNAPPSTVSKGMKPVASLEGDMMKQSALMNAEKRATELEKQIKAIEEEKKLAVQGVQPDQPFPPGQPVVQSAFGTSQKQGNGKGSSINTLPPPPMPQGVNSVTIPPPPGPPSGSGQPGTNGHMAPPDAEIGDISIVSSSKSTSDKVAVTDDKKKDLNNKVYLPPSFMEATLLSGLDAPTTSDAKGNPVPVLIRVKTPAVLPNSVKANLKGCFVIADGKGNLATERAELVLVSLSCLDRRGQAVVDQKIKGFVVDEDGKIGLRGKVVAKMGSMIARSMAAGFFGGAGDAIKASATTTSISPLGTTQAIDAKNIGLAGAGAGLSNAFKEIEKFYMDLARQTLPVIEVGATKQVTLVISEGSNLEIKKVRGVQK